MDKVFNIIPASSGAFTWLWVFGIVLFVILLGVIAVFASFGYQARHATVALSDQGLKIGPGLYSRTIPKASINAAGVKVVNLTVDKDYQPKWRTSGTGLPGYSAGWFKLQNKEKALLFITDRSSVVYIPTTDNYSLMVSVREADVMVQDIKNWK